MYNLCYVYSIECLSQIECIVSAIVLQYIGPHGISQFNSLVMILRIFYCYYPNSGMSLLTFYNVRSWSTVYVQYIYNMFCSWVTVWCFVNTILFLNTTNSCGGVVPSQPEIAVCLRERSVVYDTQRTELTAKPVSQTVHHLNICLYKEQLISRISNNILFVHSHNHFTFGSPFCKYVYMYAYINIYIYMEVLFTCKLSLLLPLTNEQTHQAYQHQIYKWNTTIYVIAG